MAGQDEHVEYDAAEGDARLQHVGTEEEGFVQLARYPVRQLVDKQHL